MGNIEKHLDHPCPVVLVEALLDKDDNVRYAAGAEIWFLRKSAAPGCVNVLLRGVRDDRDDIRNDCVMFLGHLAPKDARSLAAMDAAKTDRAYIVRNSAYCAKFIATDDLDENLRYMIRTREEPEEALKPAPLDTELAKRDRCARNLVEVASAMRLVEWSENRADQFAAELMKLLGDDSATTRRGAARIVGFASRKIALAKQDEIGQMTRGLLPFLAADHEIIPKDSKPPANEKPEPSKLLYRLETLQVTERLKKMREADPDPTVREVAAWALERLEAVRPKKP
jgi:hypothetical protein